MFSALQTPCTKAESSRSPEAFSYTSSLDAELPPKKQCELHTTRWSPSKSPSRWWRKDTSVHGWSCTLRSSSNPWSHHRWSFSSFTIRILLTNNWQTSTRYINSNETKLWDHLFLNTNMIPVTNERCALLHCKGSDPKKIKSHSQTQLSTEFRPAQIASLVLSSGALQEQVWLCEVAKACTVHLGFMIWIFFGSVLNATANEYPNPNYALPHTRRVRTEPKGMWGPIAKRVFRLDVLVNKKCRRKQTVTRKVCCFPVFAS